MVNQKAGITLPKHFTQNYVTDFLDKAAPFFKYKDRHVPDFVIDGTKVHNLSILSVLILYKFIEYTSSKRCFYRPALNVNEYLDDYIKKIGFYDLLKQLIINGDISYRELKRLNIKLQDKFLIAPQPLLRNDSFSMEALNSRFLPELERFYSYDSKIVGMIFQCLSEILVNFWEHAIEDSNSVVVAIGNKQYVEIACADTGNGIVTTLSPALSGKKITPESVLRQSVELEVTSKKETNHMGYGLWILDQITLLTNGKFHLYSEGAFYIRERSKVSSGSCGYWKGSILYLYLPLDAPKSLKDIAFNPTKGKSLININFA